MVVVDWFWLFSNTYPLSRRSFVNETTGTIQKLAHDTLHEIIRAGLFSQISPIGGRQDGEAVSQFVAGLYSGLIEMYQNPSKH
jgi:hypothetical protein